jgi:hypothetical protein
MSDYLINRRNQKLFGKAPDKKEPKPIAKISQKKKKELAGEDKSDLDKWFEERRAEMTGVCLFCGSPTEKHNDDTFKHSVAHLLPKRQNMFPSIACHPDNWIELCFYSNSCHTNFDTGIITWEFLADSKEWEVIAAKFLKIYPYIPENEKRNIPEVLLRLVEPPVEKLKIVTMENTNPETVESILELTCSKKEKILKLHAIGKSNKEIGELVGSNQGHVWNVINEKPKPPKENIN